MKKLALIFEIIFLLSPLAMAQGGFYEAYDYNRWLSEFSLAGALITTTGSQFVDGLGRTVKGGKSDLTKTDDWVGDFSYEGRHARWMVLASGVVERSTDADEQPRLENSRQFAEAAIGLMPIGEGFYLLTGGRFNDAEIRVSDVDNDSSASVNSARQWLDPFAGMRLDLGLFDWLAIRFYGDVGGFGVGSKTTWNASTSLRWRLGGFVLHAGYQISKINFESDEEVPFIYNIFTRSPSMGLSFSF